MRLNRVIQRLPKPLSPDLERLLDILGTSIVVSKGLQDSFCSESGKFMHLSFSDKVGLKSTDQVVFTERSEIFKLVKQYQISQVAKGDSNDAFSLRTFNAVYDLLYDQCLSIESAPATRGDNLLLAEEEKIRDLHWDGTGLEGLDEVLHGFSGTGIIELTGKSDAGKTVCGMS
jgi:hypothetical protein